MESRERRFVLKWGLRTSLVSTCPNSLSKPRMMQVNPRGLHKMLRWLFSREFRLEFEPNRALWGCSINSKDTREIQRASEDHCQDCFPAIVFLDSGRGHQSHESASQRLGIRRHSKIRQYCQVHQPGTGRTSQRRKIHVVFSFEQTRTGIMRAEPRKFLITRRSLKLKS